MKKYITFAMITVTIFLISACDNTNVDAVDGEPIPEEPTDEVQATLAESYFADEIQRFFDDSAVVEYIAEDKRYIIYVSDYDHMQYLVEFTEKPLVDVSDVAKAYVRGVYENLSQFSQDIYDELGSGYSIRFSDPADHNNAIIVYVDGERTHNEIY